MSDASESVHLLVDPAERDRAPMPVRLWRSRELIFTLVKRDLKIRYKASALGFLWSFGRPLLLMAVIWAVFSAFGRLPSSHDYLPYALHLLTALLPWMFFSGALNESIGSVMGNAHVVKKVWLPVEVFPASVAVGHLVHFLLAMVPLSLFIAGYALFGTAVDPHTEATVKLGTLILPRWEILLLPLLILLQTLLIFGFALILSALYVFYRDTGSITEILLTAWFYLTPIIYAANFARDRVKSESGDFLWWVYMSNPMTPIIVAYRRILYGKLFGGAPEVSDMTLLIGLGISVATTGIVLLVGIHLFDRMSRRFADEL